jgi:hypothetical protein
MNITPRCWVQIPSTCGDVTRLQSPLNLCQIRLAPLGVLAPDIPQPSFVTYLVPKPLRDPDDDVHFRVTTRESRTIVESGTTGLHTWKASLVMAEFLTFHSGKS